MKLLFCLYCSTFKTLKWVFTFQIFTETVHSMKQKCLLQAYSVLKMKIKNNLEKQAYWQ